MTVVISRVFLKKITPFFWGGIRGIGCINHLYTCYKDDEKVQVLIFEFFFSLEARDDFSSFPGDSDATIPTQRSPKSNGPEGEWVSMNL